MHDHASDQAQGLRHMTGPEPVKVIAVTGGKGGVGKTCASINLTVALSHQKQKVLLLDADLGLANVDVLLGLHPRYNLSHVLSGECALEDIVIDGPEGIRVVPAASGRRRMADLSAAEHAGLITAFSELAFSFDVLVVDTAAGIANSVISFSQASQRVIVVVCDDPASITDAYALMKVLSVDHQVREFHILTNMTRDAAEGRVLFNKLSRASEKFLDLRLQHFGNIAYDDFQRRAVQRQMPVAAVFPSASSAIAYRSLAEKIDLWQPDGGSRGRLEFFAERLINSHKKAAIA
ncbi:MAG: AAA family ATPase [Gammaproteobacteria bacterium]|nr:AAA family ATPase [Gammaproteobacteria bacterium]MDH3767986.1 AAA family ATPase [Gammaproteobacteria bacterium]